MTYEEHHSPVWEVKVQHSGTLMSQCARMLNFDFPHTIFHGYLYMELCHAHDFVSQVPPHLKVSRVTMKRLGEPGDKYMFCCLCIVCMLHD